MMSIRPAEENRRASTDTGGRAAWGGDPPQADAARRRLLEAAARCIAREGTAGASVAAVAAEAGVSRQTVYRYFTSRDQLTGRVLRTAAEDLRAKLDRSIAALADPADMIVEALVLGLDEVRNDPVLRAIADSSRLDGALVARIAGPPGIEWVRETLAPAVEAARWSREEADSCLELVLRMFLSLLISPGPERGPEEMRAFLYRHLVPAVGLDATEEM